MNGIIYDNPTYINTMHLSSCVDGENKTEIKSCLYMRPDDWEPIISAMAYLSNVPECGDIAAELANMFEAARDGKQYFIEIGYEDREGNLIVIGQSSESEEDEKEEEPDGT